MAKLNVIKWKNYHIFFKVGNGQGTFIEHGIQVAKAGFIYKPLDFVSHLAEAHRQIL